MSPAIQDTLLQLFEFVHRDPDSLPNIPIDEWDEGSKEWRLMESFRRLMEQVHERIEQLKLVEQQVREKEEQYRSIFEATNDAVFIMNSEDGHIIEANPAACDIYGYSYEEFIGLPPSAVIHSDQLATFKEKGLSLVRTGGTRHIQGVNLRKDGSEFPIDLHQTIFNYQGKPHILSVMRDITEQVQAEQQLREREEQYRGVFENTYDGLVISDLEDGCYVEVNPAFCRMFGYSREELIGMHSSALAAPLDQHLVDEVLETLKAGQDYQTVVGQGLRKDGTVFYVESQGTTFTYLGKPHSLAVVRDITERVEAEKQLREREALYRGIFEATSDAIAIIDQEGHYVEVNPAVCQEFGYSREELIGMPVSALSATKRFTAQALETLQAGRPYAHSLLTGSPPSWGLRKDGSVFPFDAQGSPITYRGQPHFLIVARDITEQVQAQELLEQRVEEHTRELSTLLEVSHNVASTLELKPLLNLILNQIKDVVEYTAATILIRDGDELVIVEYLGPARREAVLQIRYPIRSTGVDDIVLQQGEPVIIDDVRSSTLLAQDYREAVGDILQIFSSYQRALIVVPLRLKDRVIGMLSLASSEVGCYTAHHASLIVAIANQAAVAIENARLYEQAQELAAMEERQRLARELHDSVSQALYGISLGVHTARIQFDRNPKGLADSLDYVLELAEAALIEMRALIFELRPESLETEGLVIALTKQAAALHARQHVEVNTDLCAEPDLPFKAKQDLYRIAQEALHNTVKHAQASKIELRLQQSGEGVILEVCDNGKGFDATASFPGHLGLHSMQERVRDLEGIIQIKSSPGQGTCIRVEVPGRDVF